MHRQRLLLILLLAAVAAAAGLGLFLWQGGVAPERRPDFALLDLEGRPRSMAEWDGQVVLINFWAPWCAPCRREMPLLAELQREYGPRGLQILGPALDDVENVRAYARQMPVNYPLLVGLLEVMAVMEAYGESRLPFSVLLDRQGRIVFRHAGELSRAQAEAALLPLLQP